MIPLRKVAGWGFHTRQFLLPKSGHDLSECEDAIGINTVSRRFAVADGATEAFFAQSWAQRLASSWVKRGSGLLTRNEFRTWVATEGKAMHASWTNLDLSWYSEEKARMGSFAAFVGVQIDLEGNHPRWTAIALGDACLFHLRSGEIVRAFPISNSEDFNATPWLVASNAPLLEAAVERIMVSSGSIEQEGSLLLFSDAAAAWYLRLSEKTDATRIRFDRLLNEGHDKELAQFFSRERAAGSIKDDDIAIIKVDIQRTQNRGIFGW